MAYAPGSIDHSGGPLVDTDGDGLPDVVEDYFGTNKFDMDSDDDGLVDGHGFSEDLNNNGVVYPGETDPLDPDTDDDGILDCTEQGLTAPETTDTDLSAGYFIPDADPGSTTDPTNSDSDGDGAPEGIEDANRNGAYEPGAGESNPDDAASQPDPSPFAYTDAATVNNAAVAGPLDLIHAIFGDPIDDGDLLTNAFDKDTARCQKELLNRADRLEDTVLKELNKAKKKAIKEPAVNSAAALETALAAVLTSNDGIAKKEEQLVKKVENKCASLQALPSTIFPGACADDALAEVEDCAIAAARCVACLKMNAFDDLDLDCDRADDQNLNGSCPPAAP